MPEDAPERCKGGDARAVAEYIYGGLNSGATSSPARTARVELARLTTRQHVNAAADLVKYFTGEGEVPGTERGLRAVYYSSKDLNAGGKVAERMDRQIEFDYGTNGPLAGHIFTNGFAMQWRGSVIAEETGVYEFVLNTPNGARLWVNDDAEPVIDAWVASGEQREYAASVRLIGGRAYPLRLHYFKSKEKTAAISLRWRPPHGCREILPERNLSPAQPTPTLVLKTAFPADDSSAGYERGVLLSKAWDDAATEASIEVANHVAANLDRIARIRTGDTNRSEKLKRFSADFVSAAFRRPLTDEQHEVFVTRHWRQAATSEDAIKRVVLLALKSPRFLYPDLASQRPDEWSVAERLAWALWDSIPDRRLADAARGGRLRTRGQVMQQANRLLDDPRARAKMRQFLHHWLQLNRFEDIVRDPSLFPGFTPEVIADLRTSLNLFLEDVTWNGDSDYRTLLLADYLFVNRRLAEFYGIDGVESDRFEKVAFENGQRSGVITHPYLLAALSYPRSTSPIHRGVFLTRNFIGRPLKPPPTAVAFNEAEFAADLTMREKVTELTRPQACQSCHSVINPLGFSLEHFDAVGRFRSVEHQRAIDAISEFTADDGRTVRLAGARDVAAFAIASGQAQSVFVEQLFHQVVKQPIEAYGPGTMTHLRQAFARDHFSVRKLAVTIAVLAARHDSHLEQ